MTREEAELLRVKPPYHFNRRDKAGDTNGRVTVMFYAGDDNGQSLWVCKCFCGDYFVAPVANLAPSNFRSSCGCAHRSKPVEISVEDKILKLTEVSGYSVLSTGERGTANCQWTLRCGNGHEYSTRYSKVVNDGTRCPYCRRTGIDGGYFYLNRVVDSLDRLVAYKFGIGVSHKTRQVTQNRLSIYTVETEYSVYIGDGQALLEMERSFAHEFGKKYLTKAEMVDGYTETVPPHNSYKYILWVENYLSDLQIKG